MIGIRANKTVRLPLRPPPLDDTQLDTYLERIGIDRWPEVSPVWLERLHVAHLLTVPFENIDLHAAEPIRLQPDALFDKLVSRRRGGFCYEINGLFASLLATLGFDVTQVSSRVWMPDGDLSAPFDHLALLVEFDRPWLADVGFGNAFLTPRPLGSEWTEASRLLRTLEVEGGWQLEGKGDGWEPMYLIEPTPRSLDEFVPRCRWHETSPDSGFRRRGLVSRATPTGRVTVAGSRLIVTDEGQRHEKELADPAKRRRTLLAHFTSEIADAFERADATSSSAKRLDVGISRRIVTEGGARDG